MSSESMKFVDTYESYILADAKMAEYKKSIRIAKILDAPGMIGGYILIFGILGLSWNVSSHIVTFISNFIPLLSGISPFEGAAPVTEITRFLGITFVGFVIMMLFVYLSNRFENHANATGIDEEAISLDILAEGVDAFKNEDYEQAISNLKQFKNQDYDHISSTIKRYVDGYIDNTDIENDTNYFANTYEDLVNILVERIEEGDYQWEKQLISIVSLEDSDYYISEDESEALEERSVSYLSIIIDVLPKYRPGSIQNIFWLIYVVAAGIGVSVYLLVNETLGVITIMILLTGLQIYDRRGRIETD